MRVLDKWWRSAIGDKYLNLMNVHQQAFAIMLEANNLHDSYMVFEFVDSLLIVPAVFLKMSHDKRGFNLVGIDIVFNRV